MYSLISEIENKKLNSEYTLFTLKNSLLETNQKEFEFFTSDKNNNIRFYTKNTVTMISKFSAKRAAINISTFKFNMKFNCLFVGFADGTLIIYKPSSKVDNKITLKPHFSKINSISFSSD